MKRSPRSSLEIAQAKVLATNYALTFEDAFLLVDHPYPELVAEYAHALNLKIARALQQATLWRVSLKPHGQTSIRAAANTAFEAYQQRANAFAGTAGFGDFDYAVIMPVGTALAAQAAAKAARKFKR